jgi:RNA polymerase sigma factor (sigma-70 family)
MANRTLFLDKFTESLISVSNYNKDIFDGEDVNYRKMIASLKNIVNGELTEKQRRCIWLYYGERMKMIDIADELGIGVSSVSRHIKKAKLRVEKTMRYYF